MEQSITPLICVVLPSCAALVKPTTNSATGIGGDIALDSVLSEKAARASIFARVASIMNDRSGLRPDILSFLCEMLNKGITPLLPRDAGEGPALAKAVLGAGSCFFKGDVRYQRHRFKLPPWSTVYHVLY